MGLRCYLMLCCCCCRCCCSTAHLLEDNLKLSSSACSLVRLEYAGTASKATNSRILRELNCEECEQCETPAFPRLRRIFVAGANRYDWASEVSRNLAALMTSLGQHCASSAPRATTRSPAQSMCDGQTCVLERGSQLSAVLAAVRT